MDLLLLISGDQTHQKFNFCLVSVNPVLHWRLQYEGDISEVRTVDNSPEAFQSDGSLADVLVSVSVTAHGSHAVVDVTSHQPLPPHELLELTENSVKAVLGTEVVASSHGVTGVQADSNPRLVLHQVNYRLELSEISANGVALWGKTQ